MAIKSYKIYVASDGATFKTEKEAKAYELWSGVAAYDITGYNMHNPEKAYLVMIDTTCYTPEELQEVFDLFGIIDKSATKESTTVYIRHQSGKGFVPVSTQVMTCLSNFFAF